MTYSSAIARLASRSLIALSPRRAADQILECDSLTKAEKPCRTRLGAGYTKCQFHVWTAAQEFAEDLSGGAVVPRDPARHQLLGLGIHVAEALRRSRDLTALRRD